MSNWFWFFLIEDVAKKGNMTGTVWMRRDGNTSLKKREVKMDQLAEEGQFKLNEKYLEGYIKIHAKENCGE